MSPRIRTSPSSASRSSTPGIGGPTVPILMRSGGLIVATQVSSDMPHSSQMGMPSAAKNSSTSTGVGAAPATKRSARSRPRRSRSLERTSASARAYSSARAASTSSPACSARTLRRPTSSAQRTAARRSSSGSASKPASSAALVFSQIRGTAPNVVGRTSGTNSITRRGSAQQVTSWPCTIAP